MNQQNTPFGTPATEVQENVLFGTVGAILFSLVGAILYVVFYLCGFISAISALVGVICAIKGYEIFAKKESKRGLVIAIISAAVMIILAWYVCFCMDLVSVYEIWYEEGSVDYVPTVFECIPFGFLYLVDAPAYFLDLLWSALFGGAACWSYVANRSRKEAAIAAQQQAQARTQMLAEQQAAQEAEQKAREEAERAAADDPVARAKAFYDSLGSEEKTADITDEDTYASPDEDTETE